MVALALAGVCTPTCCEARSNTSRPFSGSAASCCWLTAAAHAPGCVSTGCASAVTTTVSLEAPIFNSTSAHSVRPAVNCNPSTRET